MAEINLLQTAQPTADNAQRSSKILTIAGAVLLGLAIIASIALYFLNRSSAGQFSDLNNQQVQLQNQIAATPNYATLISDQQKVSNLKILLAEHLDWSQLLPKFFSATLGTATYSKFEAQADGSAVITGNVGSFVDLDKLIQAYQLADFNSYIKDVKLVNIGFSNDLNKPGITFTIKVTFNQSVIKSQAPVAQALSAPTTPTIPAAPLAPSAPPLQTPTK